MKDEKKNEKEEVEDKKSDAQYGIFLRREKGGVVFQGILKGLQREPERWEVIALMEQMLEHLKRIDTIGLLFAEQEARIKATKIFDPKVPLHIIDPKNPH